MYYQRYESMKKILLLSILIATSALSILAAPQQVLATSHVADPTLLGEACEGVTGTTGSANPNCGDSSFFGRLVESVLNILSIVLGGIAVIVLVVAGIMYVASGGDPNNTKRAKDAIIYAVIGIVIAVAAQGMVRFVIGNV